MSILTTTPNCYLLDCEPAFSKELVAGSDSWILKPGEFDVDEPYFHERTPQFARKEATDGPGQTGLDPTGPRKRRKFYTPSAADVGLHEHHESIRDFLVGALEEAGAVWAEARKGVAMMQAPRSCAEGVDLLDEIDFVQQAELVKIVKGFGGADIRQSNEDDNEVIQLDKDTASTWDLPDLYGTVIKNPSVSKCKIIELAIGGQRYLIPPRASSLISDISGISSLLGHARQLGGYDLIVIDPPWPNKSATRSSHYATQDIYSLFQLPIPALLRTVDTDTRSPPLIAVWITNKPKFRKFVTDKLFPAWGCEAVAEWYWVKMTTRCEPVIPLDSPHRKPYEPLIIGRPKLPPTAHLLPNAIPTHKAIVSVPCKRHSRKPPLGDVLSLWLPQDPQCLELFARCLSPGWTSWGNECLKFQFEGYFERRGNESPDGVSDGNS
ncbi:MT-A70-domain-containing protein [Endogone sp. FLAS-F59071]|nr:MT-A70-domain-containing protein [Endogone sp. FLAS-F59071]|eukprot:RUS18886.1 MT-A70-domain-containing protein [Endogone sp. FLAS-F59071]